MAISKKQATTFTIVWLVAGVILTTVDVLFTVLGNIVVMSRIEEETGIFPKGPELSTTILYSAINWFILLPLILVAVVYLCYLILKLLSAAFS